ncbi:MAG TPA: nitric oxide-sensing protein NosP [Telmatospirillum sp.]|nr:nitric oxide-sensing protein NosP [Telmatospirillum sp.]
MTTIGRAASFASDPKQVAAELHAALARSDLSLVVVFASADRDLSALAAALKVAFGTIPVVGCSTAGEIAPSGYERDCVAAFALSAPEFGAASILIRGIRSMTLGRGQDVVRRAMQSLQRRAPWASPDHIFGFMLIDGLSGCEESVVSSLSASLGQIPLAGGSAGDSLRFQRTSLFHGGLAHEDCGLLVLVATALPFRVFKTEHFVAGNEKMVVTEADPASRRVLEINAESAASEYARIVGLDVRELTPSVFANHPMVVRVSGENFVRSIQKVNEDGSLTFYCAIDQGIVLTVAEGVDFAENLAKLFESLRHDLGEPGLVIGFDCILRRLEMEKKGIGGHVGRMMAINNVIGFATYGEQYQAMHVNQTFTGVAIGASAAS